MASTQATIDLVVRGSGAVNRLIEDVNQLESAVNRINSRSLEVATRAINDRSREIARRLEAVGTTNDPRPEVAARVDQITRSQTRATNDLVTARNRLTRASAAAARAEEQLMERSQRRTRSDSQVQRNIENKLNRNRAAASAAADQIGQLGTRLRSLDRQLAAIQRTSADALIPGLRQLIEVNQTGSIQRSIRALADEFNRLGDSATPSTAERSLIATFIPNQVRTFERLSDQLNESRARAQALRQELVAIGRNEALRQLPNIEFNVEGDLGQLRADYDRILRAQQEAAEASRENARILERNRQREGQRSELRARLREESDSINQLETDAVEAGRQVTRLQGQLDRLTLTRFREPQTGLNISLNQIQAQAESLALVANNSSIASNQFRQFTVAAEVASIKLARAQQQSFSALAAGLSTTGGIQIPEGLGMASRMAGARGLVNQVLAEMPSIETGASSAALSAYINMLESLRGLVPLLSDEFRALGEGIARANEEMNRGTGRQSPAQRQVNAELSRQADIETRINQANLTIEQQEIVRNRLTQARIALEERGVEAAREQTRGLVSQIGAMQSINRAQERRNSAVEDELSLLEGRIERIRNSDLPNDTRTALTNRGNQALDLLVGGAGIDPDLEGARRIRKELERDRIAAEKDYRNTVGLDDARSGQISRILRLEQELNKVRASGRDTTAQVADLDRVRNLLADDAVQLNRRLISDASNSLDRVADYITQQKEGIRIADEQTRKTEKQNKATEDLITKGNTLKAIQHDYNKLKAKGVSIGETEAELSDTISRIDSGQYEANEKSIEQLNTLIKKYASFVALKRRDLDENRLGPATRLGGGEQLIEQQRYERELEARGEAEKNLRNREDRLERASGYDLFLRSQRELESAYAEMNDMGREDLKQWSEKLQLSDRLKDVQTKIDAAALSEREKKDYLLDLEKARNAASQDRLVLARAITDEIEDQIKLETSSRSRSRGASFKMGPQAAPVDKITGPATTIKGREEAASQRRSAEVILENLTSLEKQGVDVSEKRASVQSIINNLRSEDLLLSNEILSKYDSQLEIAEHFLKIENKRLYNTRLQNRLDEESRKAQRPIYGMGPQAAPVDKITGPVSAVNEPEKIQDLLQRARIQQQALLGLQIKGFNVTQEQSEIQQLINELEGRTANLRDKGANLSQKLRESVERELDLGDDKIRLMNGETGLMNQILGLEDSFIEKREKLNKLLLTYNDLKKKGVQFRGEDVELEALVNSISGPLSPSLTRDFVNDLGRRLKAFQSAQSRSVQEAVAAGTFAGTVKTPEKLEKELNLQLREAYGLRNQINDLDKKAVDVSGLRTQNERIITDLMKEQGRVTADNAKSLQDQFEISSASLGGLRTEIARLKSELVEASKATGFGKSLQDFKESLQGSRTFFGDESAAQAIDKVVREFNKGTLDSTTISGDGAAAAAENVVDTYASKIRSGIPAVAKAMFDLGKAGVKGIKKALRMASPSVIMLRLAKDQIDSYVSGLEIAIPAVEAAAKEIGEAGIPNPVKAIRETVVPKDAVLRESAVFDARLISGSNKPSDAVVGKIEDFMNKTRTIADIGKLLDDFGDPSGSEFDRARAALADFYEIPAELTPHLDRGVKAAGDASANADQLQKYISELVSGLGQIGGLLETATKLAAAPAKITDPWGDIAPSSQQASKRYMGQTSFTDLASDISDPWKSIFDVTADAAAADAAASASRAVSEIEAGFGGGGGGGRPPGGPGGDGAAAAVEYEQMLDDFRNHFANLTTNPRFFGRLLSQIPDDALTTSMAGAATDIAAKGRTTAGILTGAGKIPGGLESQIESAYQDAFGRVPGGVTRLFDKIVSVFDALVGREFSDAGFGGRGGGARPPGGPGGGAGGAGDPGDFGNRLSDAEAKGAGALLSLQELQKPSEVATARLELLSNVLKEIYSQLSPTSEEGRKFNKALRETTARLDGIIASRAPDADPLLRLTRSPRLAQGISEGLIGGAFPLLFGQGAGAAVFGGLGGFAGGFAGGSLGFGLSLIGTALGTAVDTAIQGAKDLGVALVAPVENFDKLKESLTFSSEFEKAIEAAQEYGDEVSAAALIQEGVVRRLGVTGEQSLRNLGSETDRANRAFAELAQQMQVLLAGPVAGVTGFFADIAEQAAIAGRVKILQSDLNRPQREQFNNELLQRFEKVFPNQSRGFFAGNELAQSEIGLLVQQGQVQDIVDKWQDIVVAAKLDIRTSKESIERELRTQINNIGKFIEAQQSNVGVLDIYKQIADQAKASYEEQSDLDRQRYEMIESYEKSIADIRLNVSRRIQQEELNNLAKQNDIYAKQGEIRLQQLRNQNAAVSESLRGNEIGQQLFDIVAQYAEQQLEAENEIANRRRALQAEIKSIEVEIEQYKVDTAKQISDLNLSTAKQIEQIQLNIIRKNQSYDQSRFDLERKLAVSRLQLELYTAKQKRAESMAALLAEKDPQRVNMLSSQTQIYTDMEREIPSLIEQTKQLTAPAQQSFAAFGANASVSTAGVESAVAAGNQLRLRLEELSKALDSLVAAGKFNEFNSQLMNLADQGMMAAVKEFKELSASLDVLAGGSAGLGALLPQFQALDEAQKKILGSKAVQKSPQKTELEKLIPLYIRLAKVNMQAAETYDFFNSAISENLNEINSLKENINNLLAGTTAYEQALASLTARGLSPASEEAKKLLASAQELDRLRDKAEILNNIRDAATGFSDSLKGLVEQFVELKDAGEAVKAFSEELGKKSLSFVLDLAFKPIEETMQKQFIAFADMLGVDVRPEELKQLTELQKIESWANQINDGIKPIADSLVAIQKQAEAEALAKAQQQVSSPTAASLEFLNSPEHQKYFSAISKYAKLQLSGYYDEASVRAQAEMYGRDQRNTIYGDTRYTQEQKDAIYARVISLLEEQEKLRLEAIRGMTGQGGPDMPETRYSPLKPEDLVGGDGSLVNPSLAPSPVPVYVVPGPGGGAGLTPLLGGPTGIDSQAVQEINKILQGTTGAIQQVPAELNKTTNGIKQSSTDLGIANNAWLKGLGGAVTGLAGAAAGVLGISGGIQVMKESGTYNTLMGLAGIFGGIASVAGSFSSLGKSFGGSSVPEAPPPPSVPEAPPPPSDPGAPAAPRAAGGPVFGNNPYLVGEQGPELFIPSGNGMIIPNHVSISGAQDFEDVPFTVIPENSDLPYGGEQLSDSAFSRSAADDSQLQDSAFSKSAADDSQLQDSAFSSGVSLGAFVKGSTPNDSTKMAESISSEMFKRMGIEQVPFTKSVERISAERLERETLSAINNPSPIDIRYESQVINQVEYVTAEQHRKGMSQAAERGRALALDSIQNSVKARRKIGMA